MDYAVIYEKSGTGWGAYVPDLPGCVATGRTRPVVERRIREAIAMHLEGMREDGIAPPPPTSYPAAAAPAPPPAIPPIDVDELVPKDDDDLHDKPGIRPVFIVIGVIGVVLLLLMLSGLVTGGRGGDATSWCRRVRRGEVSARVVRVRSRVLAARRTAARRRRRLLRQRRSARRRAPRRRVVGR